MIASFLKMILVLVLLVLCPETQGVGPLERRALVIGNCDTGIDRLSTREGGDYFVQSPPLSDLVPSNNNKENFLKNLCDEIEKSCGGTKDDKQKCLASWDFVGVLNKGNLVNAWNSIGSSGPPDLGNCTSLTISVSGDVLIPSSKNLGNVVPSSKDFVAFLDNFCRNLQKECPLVADQGAQIETACLELKTSLDPSDSDRDRAVLFNWEMITFLLNNLQ